MPLAPSMVNIWQQNNYGLATDQESCHLPVVNLNWEGGTCSHSSWRLWHEHSILRPLCWTATWRCMIRSPVWVIAQPRWAGVRSFQDWDQDGQSCDLWMNRRYDMPGGHDNALSRSTTYKVTSYLGTIRLLSFHCPVPAEPAAMTCIVITIGAVSCHLVTLAATKHLQLVTADVKVACTVKSRVSIQGSIVMCFPQF